MSRDEQFEVQYLLSLMVVVLGLTTSNIDNILSQIVGIAFLFISSIHLLLLTSYYSLEKGSEMELPIASSIRGYSRKTLQLTTIGFLYLLTHTVCYALLRRYAVPVWGFSVSTVKTIITFGLPLLLVGVMSGTFLHKVWKPYRVSRDISLNIIPDSVRLYPEFEDSDPVLVEILNDGRKTYNLELSIELPATIIADIDRETHADTYQKQIALTDDREPIHLRLRHNAQETQKELIRVRVEHDHGTIEEEIECILRP